MANSSVVLICIQNPDFINITVTHVYQNFIQFGTIEKILIFERNKPIWKALVQFDSVRSALNALQLNNTIMHGLSILVYESNRKGLDFQARNQYARYYTAQQVQGIVHSTELPKTDPISKWLPHSQILPPQTGMPPIPTQFAEALNFDKADGASDYDSQEEATEDKQEELSNQFVKCMGDNLTQLFQFSPGQRISTSQQLPNNIQVEKQIFQSEILPQKKLITKVLYANWFDPKQTSMTMIYNIFSTFGNIQKMIYFKTKCNVLIEYSTEVSVKFLLTNFNEGNPTLFGQKLKVYPSNYEFIFFRNCEEGQLPKNTEEEEFYLGNEASFRYKDNNFKYLVSPSQQIMLTNLKKEFCEEGIIYDTFSKFGQIEKIKIFCEEKNKNKCLIRYQELDSAMQAMAIMHNYEYNKRKIQIFFSKNKT
ncbi:unnamed protein product [Paramecium primaurelia]|uniref:RRM domain-containing protein n=2 Tax=Paramecium TaxID=5884 RepID=A0A8S1VP95_9CILI|nr:unnamed protein product [Paramecium primaurelia]CAD8177442.1 unnamed protein product [Paramecium pentaurelia]